MQQSVKELSNKSPEDFAKSFGYSDDEINSLKEMAKLFSNRRKQEESFNDFSWDDSYLPAQEPQFEQRGGMSMVDGSVRGGMTMAPRESQQSAIMPGKFQLTQPFGNYNPALYRGVTKDMRNRGSDFSVPSNTPIALPEGEWEVIQAFGGARPGQRGMINSGYGNSVQVRNRRTGEIMRYSHLNKVGVQPGQVVKGGTVIGLSGDTGNATGSHLDLEYIDPRGRLADVTRSRYANQLFGN